MLLFIILLLLTILFINCSKDYTEVAIYNDFDDPKHVGVQCYDEKGRPISAPIYIGKVGGKDTSSFVLIPPCNSVSIAVDYDFYLRFTAGHYPIIIDRRNIIYLDSGCEF